MANDPVDNPQAAMCREMAAKATDDDMRRYWQNMAQFWVKRDEKALPAIVKLGTGLF